MIDKCYSSFLATAFISMFLSACTLSPLTGTGGGTGAPIAIKALSEEFVYVGAGLADGDATAPHSTQEVPLPTRYQVGQQYVFHHRVGPDNDQLFDVIQRDLRIKGITVLEATRGDYRYIGGLAFRISAKDQTYDIRIFNTLDNTIVKDEILVGEWEVDDYILVVEEGPRN